ncbi:RNA polymerase sigma factor [Yinghuangia seranimata]|uniref:RNA polymerase sigma factor n=1 Tax=Yinghuangia seranimata TaxID=408067 RepID=UPI00248C4E67|nr:sigma-70 family RNA polymerase sigma factor [Yinghuangia seranimata]MDI2130787.1 sigma-70 family RNA polymerase sigma factor [Yinghuangia seranimata]
MKGQGVQVGRDEAFRDLYREHYNAVFRYAWRRVGPDTAHDVAAEVFLIAWRRWETVPRLDPLPWLYGVGRGVVQNFLRSENRGQQLEARLMVERDQPGRDLAEQAAERDTVVTAWQSLGETDREVLALVGWEALDISSAAKVMGCSVPAFTARLYRAKRRLRNALDRQDVDNEDPRDDPKVPVRVGLEERCV